MHTKITFSAAALAATLVLSPLQAQALDLINTQTPSGGAAGSLTLDSSNWVAEAFAVAGSTQITRIEAYLLSNSEATDIGKTFTLALYADNASSLPALDFNADNQGQLFHATATYTGAGWNGLSGLNWTLGPGRYWLALESSGDATSTSDLLAPTGASPAALAVAYYAGGQRYAAASASDTFGLHISATAAVPEPDSLALLLAGAGIMGVIARRRRIV
jgi:hypothetical protein